MPRFPRRNVQSLRRVWTNLAKCKREDGGDEGGKQEANGGKLAFIRAVQAFTCHGGGRQAGGSAAFQFYQLDFYVTHRFFVSFLTQERNVLFVSFVLPVSPYTSTGTSARRRRLYSPPNRTGRPVISRRARAYQRSWSPYIAGNSSAGQRSVL